MELSEQIAQQLINGVSLGSIEFKAAECALGVIKLDIEVLLVGHLAYYFIGICPSAFVFVLVPIICSCLCSLI